MHKMPRTGSGRSPRVAVSRRTVSELRHGHRGVLVVLVAFLLVLAACGGGDATTTAGGTETTAGGTPTTVTIALETDVTTLDHTQRQGVADLRVLNNVYDHLTFRARDGSVEPMIATSWETAPDGMSCTIHLREDVIFHDGTKMTAEDVRYSIMRMFDPAYTSEARGDFESLTDMVVIDDYTIRADFNRPDPLFMMNAASRSAIVPKAFASSMSFEEFGQTGMGSGPYKIVEWVKDDHLTLEANPDYWQGKPAIDRVIFRPIPEASARTAALLAGEVDIVVGLSIDQMETVANSGNAEVKMADSLTRQRLIMNANLPPFDDVRVRKAVNLAINAQAIIDNILGGTAKRMGGFNIESEYGYLALDPYPYDPEQAKALLAEAGYADGLTVDFPARADYQKSAEVVQAIAADLAAVGITANIQMQERADFQKAQEAQELIFGYTGHGGGGTMETSFGLISVWNCWTEDKAHAGYFCDERIHQIMNEAPAIGFEQGLDAMYEKYKEVQQIVYDEYAQGTLWNQLAIYGVNKKLKWTPHPDETTWMFEASW
jgi:peptide/nickel transport system substrate-binding protein